MNALALNAVPTMSSLEIANLCEKRHSHVMVDCRKLADFYGQTYSAEKAAELVRGSSYEDASGRTVPCFALTRQATLDLVTGYSLAHRHAVNKRWQELEARAAQPAIDLNDPAFLRGALLQYTERVLTLEAAVAEQAPAVEFAKAVRNTSDTITMSQMAAVLGIGRNRFYARLRADHILMADNLPYQIYKDRGLFRVIESVWIDEAKEPHPTFKTVVTGRGQVYLQRKYSAEVTA